VFDVSFKLEMLTATIRGSDNPVARLPFLRPTCMSSSRKSILLMITLYEQMVRSDERKGSAKSEP
jgi:hypothetical protein